MIDAMLDQQNLLEVQFPMKSFVNVSIVHALFLDRHL